MLNEYDNRCIEEIQMKTGINQSKVKKYYEDNNKDKEKTLRDIQKKLI